MKTEGIPNPNQEGGQNEHKPSLKEKAVFQLNEFFGMFLYLWILFGLFVIHQSIILAQEHINYQAQGFAIINLNPGKGNADWRRFASREKVRK